MTRPIAPSEDGAVLSELSTNCTLQQHTTMDGVIRVNGADTDLENLHSGTGVLTNLSDTVTLSSGDKVATLRRPAGAGGSSRIGWFAGVFEAPNNSKIKKHAINLIGGGTEGAEAFQSNSTTEWVNLIGRTAANQGTEDLGSSFRVRGTYEFRHLFVTVDANTRVVDSNFVSRINKADGDQLVVITAGVTGTFENLGDSDQVQWGDQIGAAGRNFTGGGSWNMQISGAELVDFKGRLGIQGLGDGIGQGHNPNQTRLVSLSDDFNTTFNFDHLYVVPHRMTLGFFHCPISGNTNIQETEQIVRVDNADTDVGQFTPPLTTGDFENIVDTVIVRETSVISGIRLYTGSGSSGTITYEGTISFQTTTAPRFQMEPVVFNADPLTGDPLGLGQTVCVQLGPAVTAEPPAGTLALAGLAPVIPQNAVIIPIPSGHLCLRGPLNPVQPVEIDVPAGGLTFGGQIPTIITGITRAVPVGCLYLDPFGVFASGLLDDFNRANENPIVGWTKLTDANDLQIVGNEVTGTTGGFSGAMFDSAPVSNCETYVTFTGAPTGSTFLFRMVGPDAADQDGYLVHADTSPQTFYIQRVDGGALTTLDSIPMPTGGDAEVGDQMGLRIIGSRIEGWYRRAGEEWKRHLVATDSTYSSGLLGLQFATGGALDDFGGTGDYYNPRLDFVCPAPAGTLTLAGLVPTRVIGQTLEIPTGALVLNGLAPQAFVQRVAAPPAGALVLNGLAPTVSTGVLRAVPVGTLVLAGLAPQAFVERFAAPPAGTLILAGLTPSLDFELHPGTGALVLAGLTPNLFTTVLRSVPAGALVLAGAEPTVAHTIPVPTGALQLQGLAPQAFVQRIVAPPAGALVLTGQLPLCITGIIRSIPTGTLVLAGLAPTVEITVRRDPPVGTLILQGLVPGVFTGLLRTPPTGTLVLQGQTPTRFVEEQRFPGAGTLVLAGQTPSLDFGVEIPAGTLVLAGLAPQAFVSRIAAPPAGALVLQGLAPSLAFVCPAPAGALVLAGLVPTVVEEAGAITRTPPTGALVLQGQAPTVTTGFVIDIPVGSLVLAGQTPTLFEESIRQPGAGALVLQGLVPTLGGGTLIDVPTGALVLAGATPTLGFACDVSSGTLVLQGLAPTLGISYSFDVPTGTLVLQGQTPTLISGANPQPGAGSLVLAGLAPIVGRGIDVPAGSLTLAGLLPLYQFNTVPTGQLVLAGLAPTRITTQSIAVPSTELRLDGYAPQIAGDVDLIITIQTQLRLDGHTPVPDIGQSFAGAGTLTLAGQVPTLSFLVGGGGFFPGAGQLVLQGLAPSQGFTSPAICPAPAALVLAGTVNVEAALVVDVPTGAMVLQGHVPESAIVSSTFDVPTLFNMRRLRQAPFLEQEDDRIYHERFQLNLQIGIGLETGVPEVLDPKITLDWSDDSAHTWSNTYPVSAGPVGTELRVRALWYRLGAPRKRIYRVTMDTPVKWALIDAYIQLKRGTN